MTFKNNLEDRFGKTPVPVNELLCSMRLKWIAKELGFEKLNLKNGDMRAYFTKETDSKYFESDMFGRILEYLKLNFRTCRMIEKNSRLTLIIMHVNSASKAIDICKKILR